ncbi:Pr6Pr family membrane protein [Herbiconiux sp. YIM B11900]|uniref:Pr6Pr family membrane protein n=1 Tax=Herbiconiux sp. YIM B11900 TaxID=3404131 RepID=UPI003F85D9EC
MTLANDFGIVDFFSYFTNLGNLIAIAIFVVGAVRTLRRMPESGTADRLRFISVVNMVFIGLVFNFLLTGVDVGAVLPWVNVVVHIVMPLAVLLDWILIPPHRPLAWRLLWIGLVFPVVYSLYSLVRGAITGFYPYPFYNPAALGGYGPVALYLVALIVGLTAVSALVLLLGRRRRSAVQG